MNIVEQMKDPIFKKGFDMGFASKIIYDSWDEDDHPRDEGGRFTVGGGGYALNSKFGGANPRFFSSKLATAKEAVAQSDPDSAWRVSTQSEKELHEDHPDSKMHVTKGGSTVAVGKDGDIFAVCRNPNDTLRGRDLLEMAVKNGGTKLDSFDGNHKFYTSNGFEPVSWTKFDPNYAPPDWDKNRHNAENVIFYKYTGKNTNETAKEFYARVKASKDYDAAKAARNKEVK